MTVLDDASLPKHVAIIMDGNNRFAKKNQMQKGDGHREGKNSLDPIVEECCLKGIKALTVFAFSSENWNRPKFEVDLLMALLEETIDEQLPRMKKFNIALQFIGDRSRLPSRLTQAMSDAEKETAGFDSMTLTIAVSYGGMWDITQTTKQIALDVKAGILDPEKIDTSFFNRRISLYNQPPVDLLIRTGGDYRLSNFLLWQAAYAELYFTETLWPEFSVQEFNHALDIFIGRERRFGKTSEQLNLNQD